MVEKEISPPSDNNDVLRRRVMERQSKARGLSDEMFEKIDLIFSAFEYELGKTEDVAVHILDSDIDTALEDAVPMFSFFSMCANKARDKEEFFVEALKTMEMQSVKTKKENIATQKGGIRSSAKYLQTQKALRRWKKIRRDCEDMAEAMKLRVDVSQTKSANARVSLGGPWQNKI